MWPSIARGIYAGNSLMPQGVRHVNPKALIGKWDPVIPTPIKNTNNDKYKSKKPEYLYKQLQGL